MRAAVHTPGATTFRSWGEILGRSTRFRDPLRLSAQQTVGLIAQGILHHQHGLGRLLVIVPHRPHGEFHGSEHGGVEFGQQFPRLFPGSGGTGPGHRTGRGSAAANPGTPPHSAPRRRRRRRSSARPRQRPCALIEITWTGRSMTRLVWWCSWGFPVVLKRIPDQARGPVAPSGIGMMFKPVMLAYGSVFGTFWKCDCGYSANLLRQKPGEASGNRRKPVTGALLLLLIPASLRVP